MEKNGNGCQCAVFVRDNKKNAARQRNCHNEAKYMVTFKFGMLRMCEYHKNIATGEAIDPSNRPLSIKEIKEDCVSLDQSA